MRSKWHLFTLGALLSLWAHISFAALTQEEVDYLTGNPERAIAELVGPAKGGDISAQYLISHAYRLRKDEREADAWLRTAATGGHPDAQFDFALTLSQRGKGNDALAWFERAMAKGHVGAKTEVAWSLYFGHSGMTDKATAIRLRKEAAEANDRVAQFWLGDAYRFGLDGYAVDYEAAALWLKKAADQGLREAKAELGDVYLVPRSSGNPKFRPYSGHELYEEAGNLGHAGAQFMAGLLYMQGKGKVMTPDYDGARKWFAQVINNEEASPEQKKKAQLLTAEAVKLREMQLADAKKVRGRTGAFAGDLVPLDSASSSHFSGVNRLPMPGDFRYCEVFGSSDSGNCR
ncbi:tetratricopeptide repeat protein [Aromatoleum petrolei]|nr:tetratricopeptide repeat protein [Aromatoleum petrolei]